MLKLILKIVLSMIAFFIISLFLNKADISGKLINKEKTPEEKVLNLDVLKELKKAKEEIANELNYNIKTKNETIVTKDEEIDFEYNFEGDVKTKIDKEDFKIKRFVFKSSEWKLVE